MQWINVRLIIWWRFRTPNCNCLESIKLNCTFLIYIIGFSNSTSWINSRNFLLLRPDSTDGAWARNYKKKIFQTATGPSTYGCNSTVTVVDDPVKVGKKFYSFGALLESKAVAVNYLGKLSAYLSDEVSPSCRLFKIMSGNYVRRDTDGSRHAFISTLYMCTICVCLCVSVSVSLGLCVWVGI